MQCEVLPRADCFELVCLGASNSITTDSSLSCACPRHSLSFVSKWCMPGFGYSSCATATATAIKSSIRLPLSPPLDIAHVHDMTHILATAGVA